MTPTMASYDVLLVHALDRMARSARDATYVFDELNRAGVLILSVTDVVGITSLGQRTWTLIRNAIGAKVSTSIPIPGDSHEA